jgi:regulator of protease activity HflC (stomatin/prohibitin superfamily)
MQFARFVRELQWPVTAAPPPVRAITGEINALDADMTKAYETMDRASHPSYISASAALKQAKTLNARGQHAGALFQYLLARLVFAPLRAPAGADATAERIAAARAALPGGDHSVAELFLQLAEEGISGSQPAQRRGAAAVLDDVLPAYLAAIAPPATTAPAPAAARVTITLVRWPYT